mgnify:CR=1 FL=1
MLNDDIFLSLGWQVAEQLLEILVNLFHSLPCSDVLFKLSTDTGNAVLIDARIIVYQRVEKSIPQILLMIPPERLALSPLASALLLGHLDMRTEQQQVRAGA